MIYRKIASKKDATYATCRPRRSAKPPSLWYTRSWIAIVQASRGADPASPQSRSRNFRESRNKEMAPAPPTVSSITWEVSLILLLSKQNLPKI